MKTAVKETNSKTKVAKTSARRVKKERRGWSTGDVNEMKAVAVRRRKDRAIPWTTICNKLKRTEGAIRQKAHSLGVSFS